MRRRSNLSDARNVLRRKSRRARHVDSLLIRKKAKHMPASTTVAEYLTLHIERSPLTQKAIAEALDYPQANIVTMFKQGLTKLPIGKVPALADVLGVSRSHLLRLVLSEYHPEMLGVVEGVVGVILSENEIEAIQTLRRVSHGADPAIRTTKAIDLLTQAVAA